MLHLHFKANDVRLLLFGITILIFTSVATAQEAVSFSHFPGEEWQQWSSPEDAGFSSSAINRLEIACRKSGAACVLVIYDGAVLHQFGDVRVRYMCHSIRKSFISALYGIFVENGDINADSTLRELGIDDNPSPLTDEEKNASVSDLLESRSGVYHESAYEPSHMKKSRPRRGSHVAGTHWWYNNWDFNALLTIFEQETGEKFFDAFNRNIAQPIGLQDFRLRDGYYHYEPQRSSHPAYPFQMSARDMARIGLLMARGGRWRGQQVLPADWVEESTNPHSRIKNWQGFDGYGYLWWTAGSGTDRVFSAQGNGGNSMYVIPSRGLVFVFRADTYHGKSFGWKSRWRMIRTVLDGQTQVPAPHPILNPMPTPPSPIERATLSADYLEQFPLELRRELPSDLPAEIRDEPVRIESIEGTLVLFTRRPPAMSLDLIPLAEDRFIVGELNEMCAIDRDENGVASRFLLKNDLLRRIRDLDGAGKTDDAARERRVLGTLFPERRETK